MPRRQALGVKPAPFFADVEALVVAEGVLGAAGFDTLALMPSRGGKPVCCVSSRPGLAFSGVLCLRLGLT